MQEMSSSELNLSTILYLQEGTTKMINSQNKDDLQLLETSTSFKNTNKPLKLKLKNFLCTQPGCGKAFSDNAHLRDHMLVHTGEKRIQCKECGKYFARSSTLKTHTRIHSGEKPFFCSFQDCGKRFKFRSALRSHLTLHQYPCITCGKRFPTIHSLEIHYSDKPDHFHHYHLKKKQIISQNVNKPTPNTLWATSTTTITPTTIPTTTTTTTKRTTSMKKQLDESIASLKTTKKISPFVVPLSVIYGRPFRCQYMDCCATFLNYFQMVFHARRHRGIPLDCIIGKQTPLPSGPKYCPFEECEFSMKWGKPLQTLQAVKRHVKRMHEYHKTFLCTTCPQLDKQVFTTKEMYKLHRLQCKSKTTTF